MKDNRSDKRKNLKKDARLDEFLTEDKFDEEDEDSVTDDTLEFLCLDEQAIEDYQSESKSRRNSKKASVSRYDEDDEDEDDEDEDYEGEDYEDEEDEDEDYEEDDEDEEYEDDEDEDEYEYDDERGGVIVRLQHFLTEMTTLDMVVAMLGIVVIVGAVLSGALYFNAKSIEKQVAAFASVGEDAEGISVIGESGLIAVSESAKLSKMIDLEEFSEETDMETERETEEQNKSIEVTLNLTSIQSDLKIKFVNKSTGKLISGVPFEVTVSNGKKTFDLKDEDKDGIIYQTGVEAGTYEVTVKPFKETGYEQYKLPASATSVKVTDTIAYKKVDVADEVKTEAEVNVAAEDTAAQDTVVESTLQDTVEWVESTKTPIDGTENFEEIKKENIPDPSTTGAISSGFMKMVNTGVQDGIAVITATMTEPGPESLECTICRDKCKEGAVNQDCEACKSSLENCNGEEKESESKPLECTVCRDKCKEGAVNQDCEACKSSLANCKGTEPEPKPLECNCTNKCKDGNVAPNCEACKASTANCKGKEPSQPTARTIESISCPATLTVGTIGQASGKTNPEGGTITWSSSDTNVVEIESSTGKMTAKAVGTVTITAKCESDARTATVKVEAVKYTAIELSGNGSVYINENGTVTGKTTPEGGTISWTSSDEKIVKIESSDGKSAKFKGIAVGTATITAKCGDASATWKVVFEKNLKGDNTTKLKDKDGNQIYVMKDGKYVEATYADYYVDGMKFYLAKGTYIYTGWQTINGSVYFFDKNGNYVTGDQVIQGAKYTFGSDGKLSTGSGTMGIDVSKHNGNIDWNAVKNSGVSFVIIRCGYRGSSTGVLVEDPRFSSNIKGAKAAGLKVGVYFFCQAVNEVEAVEEASMAVSLVSGYGLDMPIFLDVESAGGRGDHISKETRTAVCRAFCETVQNSGYAAGIYANKTWFNEKINTSSLTSYKIWLAQYASAPTYTTTRYDMWQYSSKGRISGISTDVDLDIRYY